MDEELKEFRSEPGGVDFTRPIQGSAWAGAATVRLVWARHHWYVPGEVQYSSEVGVYSLWLVKQGTVEVNFGEESWNVRTGEAFLGRPFANRKIRTPEVAEWLSAGFRITAPGERDLLDGLQTGTFPIQGNEREELEGLLRLLVGVADWPGDGGLLARDGLARALAGWVLQKRGGGLGFSGLPDWMRTCLERVEREPGVSVDELAQQAHFSPAQFRRLFGKYVGVAPRDFLHQRRLEMARRMVEAGDEGMESVAAKCGFGGTVQLSREFKRHFGLAPLAWRRASRE